MKRILLTLLLLLTAAPAAARPAEFPYGEDDPFFVGVCTHFVQRKGWLPENLRLTVDANVMGIRDESPWSQVEQTQGELKVPERVDAYVDAALGHGLPTMLILGYGNRFYQQGRKPTEPESVEAYTRYARFMVEHFRGRVNVWEVWNEWNIGIGTAGWERGTPEDYVRLLEATSKGIRETDPTATVVGGVVAPQAFTSVVNREQYGQGFWERVNELGLARHCDAISVHPYIYGRQGAERRPEAWLELMQWIDAVVREHNDGESVPLLVTELGWPTHTDDAGDARGTDEHRSADYLARTYLLARTMPVIRGIWWYDLQDDGWNPAYNEDNFGVVHADGTAKPAWHALRDVAPLVAHGDFVERVETDDPELWLLRFRHEGRNVLALWHADDDAPGTRVLLHAPDHVIDVDDPPQVEVTTVGRGTLTRGFVHREWVREDPQRPVDPDAGPEPVLGLVATGTPLLVDVGDLEVELRDVRRIEPREVVRPGPATRPATRPADTGQAAP